MVILNCICDMALSGKLFCSKRHILKIQANRQKTDKTRKVINEHTLYEKKQPKFHLGGKWELHLIVWYLFKKWFSCNFYSLLNYRYIKYIILTNRLHLHFLLMMLLLKLVIIHGNLYSKKTEFEYEKRLLLWCIHHFKSDLIYKMDHMRITGTEHSSVILN